MRLLPPQSVLLQEQQERHQILCAPKRCPRRLRLVHVGERVDGLVHELPVQKYRLAEKRGQKMKREGAWLGFAFWFFVQSLGHTVPTSRHHPSCAKQKCCGESQQQGCNADRRDRCASLVHATISKHLLVGLRHSPANVNIHIDALCVTSSRNHNSVRKILGVPES